MINEVLVLGVKFLFIVFAIIVYWCYLMPIAANGLITIVEKMAKSTVRQMRMCGDVKYLVVAWECISVIVILSVILAMLFLKAIQFYLLFVLPVAYFATTSRIIRKEYSNLPSIFRPIEKLVSHPDSTAKFFILIVKQMVEMLFILIPLFVILWIFFVMSWPINVYFMGFIALPTVLNWWIYISVPQDNDNAKIIGNVRKTLVYFLLCLAVIGDGYNRYQGFIGINFERMDFPNFFFSITTLLFTAMERMLKALIDGYEEGKCMK